MEEITTTKIVIGIFALIGASITFNYTVIFISRHWYRIIGYCYLLPQYRFMEWSIKRRGWKPANYINANGKSFVDPDHWVHPNHDKEMTLYGAYHTK